VPAFAGSRSYPPAPMRRLLTTTRTVRSSRPLASPRGEQSRTPRFQGVLADASRHAAAVPGLPKPALRRQPHRPASRSPPHMTTPIVIEQPLPLEAVTSDPFIEGSARAVPTATDTNSEAPRSRVSSCSAPAAAAARAAAAVDIRVKISGAGRVGKQTLGARRPERSYIEDGRPSRQRLRPQQGGL
jgi:hypothetical protein